MTCLTITTKYLGTDFLGTIFNIIVIHYTDDSDSNTDMPFWKQKCQHASLQWHYYYKMAFHNSFVEYVIILWHDTAIFF